MGNILDFPDNANTSYYGTITRFAEIPKVTENHLSAVQCRFYFACVYNFQIISIFPIQFPISNVLGL